MKTEVMHGNPKQRSTKEKLALVLIGILIIISSIVISSYALFAGNHNLYINKTNAHDFCIKCHPDKVTIMNLASNPHKNSGCICHGYNPNVTQAYNINVAHNLTKNIYCTNCHTSYNSTTGNIMIHGQTLAAPNQSAHYLINNSNKNLIYQNAQGFFNNSRR
jgi:hypothetical protein